jgi:hypothetical protein
MTVSGTDNSCKKGVTMKSKIYVKNCTVCELALNL